MIPSWPNCVLYWTINQAIENCTGKKKSMLEHILLSKLQQNIFISILIPRHSYFLLWQYHKYKWWNDKQIISRFQLNVEQQFHAGRGKEEITFIIGLDICQLLVMWDFGVELSFAGHYTVLGINTNSSSMSFSVLVLSHCVGPIALCWTEKRSAAVLSS